MWVVDQLIPGNPVDNLPMAYRLRGELDVAALEKTFNKIIERHEIWRTTFHVSDGDGVQEIHPECKIEIQITELDQLAAGDREAAASSLASQEGARPFDLRKLPLVRVSLFKLDPCDHVLLINLHHIVGDGLSMNVIFDEVDAIYRAFASGAEPQVPELTAQYADFAVWQRGDLSKAREFSQTEFWRRELAGHLPLLDIPTDKPRPRRRTFSGSIVHFPVPEPLVKALTSVANTEKCTFFTIVLAAYQVLLLRYSKGDEIVIGTPVVTRPLPETERMIGNFLNIIALRGDLSGNPPFVEVLRRTKETTLNALSNKDLPFETVVSNLKFRRDPSRNPVFQAMIQILPAVRPRIGGLGVDSFPFEVMFGQIDLILHLYEDLDGSFLGQIQYCTDLFERSTIERLSRDFIHLLREIVEDPTRKLLEPASTSPVLPNEAHS